MIEVLRQAFYAGAETADEHMKSTEELFKAWLKNIPEDDIEGVPV